MNGKFSKIIVEIFKGWNQKNHYTKVLEKIDISAKSKRGISNVLIIKASTNIIYYITFYVNIRMFTAFS
jgi:hypothetical protein